MCRWGAERRVNRAQTRERGPPSVLAVLKLCKLSCVFPIVTVGADHVQDAPAHVDHLPPARITLQPEQLHACSPEVPSSGHAKAAP